MIGALLAQPWMGGYLSPDAEYRAGVMAGAGAQAYAYKADAILIRDKC